MMKLYLIIFFIGGVLGYSLAPYPEASQVEAYDEDNLSDSEEFKKDVALLKTVAPKRNDDADKCPGSPLEEPDTTSRDIASIDFEEQKEEILSDTTSEEREIIENMPNEYFLRPMEF